MTLGECLSLICHRLPARTFSLNGRLMMLCSRCSGIYTGFLVGFAFQAIFGKKRTLLPPASITFTGLAFIGFMALQSVASPAFLSNSNPWRFTTGIFCGGSVSLFLFPVWNEYLFQKGERKPAIATWPSYLSLLGILCSISLFSFSTVLKNQVVFQTLDYLSVVGVVVTYLTINTFLAALVSNWREKKKNFLSLIWLGLLVLSFFFLEFLLLYFNPLKGLLL